MYAREKKKRKDNRCEKKANFYAHKFKNLVEIRKSLLLKLKQKF